MPKIRGIKPELWTDESFVELSPYARLLWIGLWNYACDNGHIQDKSKQIKMRLLPTDDVNAADLLREIEKQGLIERADGWITIPNLSAHQKPHKRWYVVCDKPGCEHPEGTSYGFERPQKSNPEPDSTVEQPLVNDETAPDNGGSTADVDVDVDSDGDLRVTTASSAANASSQKKKPSRATRRPDDFRPSQAHVDLAAERGIDLREEWARFCDWSDANGKTYKDWPAALRNWIRNARPSRQAPGQRVTNTQQHLALAKQLHDEEQGQMIQFPQIGESR